MERKRDDPYWALFQETICILFVLVAGWTAITIALTQVVPPAGAASVIQAGVQAGASGLVGELTASEASREGLPVRVSGAGARGETIGGCDRSEKVAVPVVQGTP